MARKLLRGHDYAQAVQLLQDIPPDFRSLEIQQTLDEALELQEESDLLLLSLQECVRRRQLRGIEDNLKRFLKLKPGNKFARDLWDSLQTYSRVSAKQRRYKYDETGNLQPLSSGSLWDNWLLIGTLCFAFVFGLMTWAIVVYLKDGKRTLAVEVNDAWLKEQGGQLSLSVDGKEHTITGPGMEIKVTFGKHGFSVKNGDTVVHNPQTFTIEKGTTQVLRIDGSGMRLANAGTTPSPSPDKIGTSLNSEDVIAINAPRTPLPDGPAGLVKRLHGHTGYVNLRIAADGRTLVSIGTDDGDLRIWDLESGEARHVIESKEYCVMAVHPQCEYVAVNNINGTKLLDLKSGKELASIPPLKKRARSMDVSPDGNYLAIDGHQGGGVSVWDVSSLADIKRIVGFDTSGPMSYDSAVQFLPDSQHLLVSSWEAEFPVRLFHIPTGQELRAYTTRDGLPEFNPVNWITVHPDGKRFCFWGGRTGFPLLFDLDSPTPVKQFPIREGLPVFSPDGRHVICGNPKQKQIQVYSTESGDLIWYTPTEDQIPRNLTVSPDGRFVVSSNVRVDPKATTAETTYDLLVWRLPKEVWPKSIAESRDSNTPPRTPLPDGPPGLVATLKGQTDRTTALSVSTDGQLLASGDWSRAEYIWDLSRQQIVRKLDEPEGRAVTTSFRFIPGRREILAASSGGVVRKFNIDTGAKTLSFAGHKSKSGEISNTIDSLHLLSDGNRFVTVSRNGTAAKWNIDRADAESYLELIPDSHMALVGVPVADGIVLANHPWEGPVTLHDSTTGRLLRTYDKINGGWIWADNDLDHFWHLAGTKVRRVSVKTGEVRRELLAADNLASGVLPPDGRHFIAGSDNSRIYTWDVATGVEIYRAETPCAARVMTVTPDGRFVIFGSPEEKDANHEIHIWRLPQEMWTK